MTTMNTMKMMKTPGADHPITIAPNGRRVRVMIAGTVVADSTRALALQESTYKPVLYIPRADARMDLLTRTTHSTHCPYKGDARTTRSGSATASARTRSGATSSRIPRWRRSLGTWRSIRIAWT